MSHDSLHGDPELDARALEAQKLCTEVATQALRALQRCGFEHIVVRVAKLVRGKDGHCALPGATVAASDPAITPCLPLEAAELRHIADRMEAVFRRSGSREAEAGYVEERDPKEYGL